MSWIQQNRGNLFYTGNLFHRFLLVLIVPYHCKSHLHHNQEFLIVHVNRPYSNTLVKELFENSRGGFVAVSKAGEMLLKVEGQIFCFNLTYPNLYEVKDLGFSKTS